MGKLLIFSAPSGSGKTTIVRELMARFSEENFSGGGHSAVMGGLPRLEFSVSATSRAPRGVEKDGVDYHFISVEEFRRRIEVGDFVEWEEVYAGNYYGTLRSEVEAVWARGGVCVFDVDVVGGLSLKQIFGDDALSFFIQAPSVDELRRRLEGRGTDSAESVERRMAKAAEETKRAGEFDHIIVNDAVGRAVGEVAALVVPFVSKRVMLYFGSFNPVHRAHIAIAEHVIERGLADMVVLVVSPQNPFKEADGLAPELARFEGAEAAAAGSRFPARIQASAVEMTLPRPSYTIDTLRFLTTARPDVEFSILVGGDNAARLGQWREADEILKNHKVYVYPREGSEAGVALRESFPAGVTVLDDAPLLEVSSTEVQKFLESGREHYRKGEFGAAANDFARAAELAPDNTEAAEFLHMIDEILNYRNTDLLNP